MTAAPHPVRQDVQPIFAHQAMLYAGLDEFVDGTLSFVRAGLEAGESVLVAVDAAKVSRLQHDLGDDARRVQFEHMERIGANPARIIPVWRAFVDAQPPGAGFRGVGEPIWAARSAAELAESQRHEALLNLAFAGSAAWQLLCPYDTSTLSADVIDEAHRSHPTIVAGDGHYPSATCRSLDEIAAPCDWPLPEAPDGVMQLPFTHAGLAAVRSFVRDRAGQMGLGHARRDDLVLAVDEVAANTLRHGSGDPVVRMWAEPGSVMCEVADRGRFDEPLAGRVLPAPDAEGGRGLWICNQVCDLVQIRSFENGTVVRLHMTL
jgi:anti-sigma regulatory factor (Ser/Thr protein kinase)